MSEDTVALILIDMSEEQLAPSGTKFLKNWRGYKNILKLADALPQSLVYDCRLWFTPQDTSSLRGLYPDIGHANNPGAQLTSELKSLQATFVKKVQYSCFFKTQLQQHLSENGVTALLLCGINTDYCIFATALDAFYLGYKVFVLQDACGTHSGPAGQKKGLSDMLRFLGDYGRVISTEQALNVLTTGSFKCIEPSNTEEF